MKTSAIRRQTLREEVAERLRRLIIEGELKDGDRIVEADLCAALSVSRTPMREAIRALAHEGLIEHLPNRGARVARVTPLEMLQLFDVIARLEQLGAELAVAVSKPIEIKRLRALHDKMAAHHKAGERTDYFALNHQIHLKIIALSRNPVLIETHATLMNRARKFRYWALSGEGRWEEAMAEHDAIMAAIEDGDGDRAGALLKVHVLRTGEVVAAAVETSQANG